MNLPKVLPNMSWVPICQVFHLTVTFSCMVSHGFGGEILVNAIHLYIPFINIFSSKADNFFSVSFESSSINFCTCEVIFCFAI